MYNDGAQVSLSGITYKSTAYTYMKPHGVPSASTLTLTLALTLTLTVTLTLNHLHVHGLHLHLHEATRRALGQCSLVTRFYLLL